MWSSESHTDALLQLFVLAVEKKGLLIYELILRAFVRCLFIYNHLKKKERIKTKWNVFCNL